VKWLELKIPPLLVGLIFGFFIWVIPFQFRIYNTMILSIASIILFSLGAVVSILGVLEFRKQKTTVNPMTPQESNNLVTKGVYKFTRNPMYLGFLLCLLSLGLFLGKPTSLIVTVLFVIYMNTFQIVPEENILEKKFGEEFLIYKKNARRWL
jgi:protein-S-isoprenylcysteine O-methyltransferase Ste14